MAIVAIGSNITSLNAQRRLGDASAQLSRSTERLASGLRINRASDDAASLSVAQKLQSDSKVFAQGLRNLGDGISLLNIADGALSALGNIVQRQTELAEQAANGVYSDAQRQSLAAEFSALRTEYSRILATTNFNGINPLSSTQGQVVIQDGFGSSGTIAIDALQGAGVSGAGTYTSGSINYGSTIRALAVGDINGDGRDDVAVGSYAMDVPGGILSFFVQLYEANADGTFTARDTLQFDVSFLTTASVSSFTIGIGNANGGATDIAMSWSGTIDGIGPFSDTGYWENNGGGFGDISPISLGSAGGISLGTRLSTNVNGDFNGDGITDYVNSSGGTTVSTFIQNTTGSSLSLSQSSYDIGSTSGARAALTGLGTLRDSLSSVRGKLGASMKRLETSYSVLTAKRLEYQSASSRLTDVDAAFESANLTRLKILQETSVSVLTQANQAPLLALQLLRL